MNHPHDTTPIAIENLKPSSRNVRKTKTSKESDRQMLASVRALGILQNLIVIPVKDPGEGAAYEVVVGKRRLKALQTLVKKGELKPEDVAPCVIRQADDPIEEISTTENTQREKMHPADEFEAFQRMIKRGATPEDVAEHFGVKRLHVEQRLKLAAVAPEIRKAYRNGDMTLEAVEAFTLADNPDAQLATYELLKIQDEDYRGSRLSPFNIRRALTDNTLKDSDRLVRFVGLKAYEKAGGATETDLFQDDVYIKDPVLIEALAIEKLQAIAAEEADDWNWQEFSLEPTSLSAHTFLTAKDTDETKALREKQEEAAKALDTLEEMDEEDWNEDAEKHDAQYQRLEDNISDLECKIDESQVYDPEEMKLAGCIYSISYAGNADITRGIVKKSQEKELRKLQGHDEPPSSSKSNEPDPAALSGSADERSQALTDDLRIYRTAIARHELAENPELALDLLTFSLALKEFGEHWVSTPIAISAANEISMSNAKVQVELTSPPILQCNLDWLQAEGKAEQFKAFRALDSVDRKRILTRCITARLCGQLSDSAYDGEATEHALALLDINWRAHWTPTAENFFGRLKKPAQIAIGRQFLGDSWAEEVQGRPRKAIAEELEIMITGRDDRLTTEQKLEVAQWTPSGFEACYSGSTEDDTETTEAA